MLILKPSSSCWKDSNMAYSAFSLVVLLLSLTHINFQEDSVEQLKLALSSDLQTQQEKYPMLFQDVSPAQ